MLDDYKHRPRIGNKSIFKLRPDDLTLLFKKKHIKMPVNKGESRISLNILKKCGYNQGICDLLGTDIENGINGDKEDLERRREAFGRHSIALPKIPSFWNFLEAQFEDPLVIMLIWMALAFLGIAFF